MSGPEEGKKGGKTFKKQKTKKGSSKNQNLIGTLQTKGRKKRRGRIEEKRKANQKKKLLSFQRKLRKRLKRPKNKLGRPKTGFAPGGNALMGK